MSSWPITIIESPYNAPTAQRKVLYANYLKACILDSISRGEAPFAGHGFYTHYLNDRDPKSRQLGIRLSLSFLFQASLVAVYLDFGWSPGMRLGVAAAQRHGVPVTQRKIHWSPDAENRY